MKHTLLFLAAFFLYSLNTKAQVVKVLFDGSKAEEAGNADWIPDADTHNLGFSTGPAVVGGGNESNPQRFPTPAQSGITSTTAETYWEGALSAWGVDCAKQGYQVETLPYNGLITYGQSSNPQDLSNYSVFIVCEPNILFTTSEKTAIMNFVQNGGGLYMISDHNVSDRNNDGADSPHIWNDLMTNNSVQANPFGMSFDYANFSETSSNIPNLPGDSLLHGPFGNVTQVKWSNGTSLTIDPTQNSTVKAVVYQTAVTTFGNTQVMSAYARFGQGKVAAIGDSSPCDDGTGDPNDVLYNGYFTDAAGNHERLLMNTTIWLASHGSVATGITPLAKENNEVMVYPNPCSGNARISFTMPRTGPLQIRFYDATGQLLDAYEKLCEKGKVDFSFSTENFCKGLIFYSLSNGDFSRNGKFIVNPE